LFKNGNGHALIGLLSPIFTCICNGVFDEKDVGVVKGEWHADADDPIGKDFTLDDGTVFHQSARDSFDLDEVSNVHVHSLSKKSETFHHLQHF